MQDVPHSSSIQTTLILNKLYGIRHCADVAHRLVETDTHMQACTSYGAGMPELLQQAVHIQQLLHMSPRDLECLFNRIKVEQQLHLTILLLVATDCRQRGEFISVADCRATLQIAIRVPDKDAHHDMVTAKRRPSSVLQEEVEEANPVRAQCAASV